MTLCGHCGTPRENGDVCCEQQARNQGRIHATCSHEPPPMPPEWLPAWNAGQDEAIAEMEASR